MWPFKKKTTEDKAVTDCLGKFASMFEKTHKLDQLELVTCHKCGVALEKSKAKVVTMAEGRSFFSPISSPHSFCKVCAPGYDESYQDYLGGVFYYKRIRVNEAGEPIGYVKASEKQNKKKQ